MFDTERMITALRFCGTHDYCEGCPEDGECTLNHLLLSAADMIEDLAAKVKEGEEND